MLLEALDFELDPALIATEPPAERDGARMMVFEDDGRFVHDHVRAFAERVPSGAVVVVNDTRVIPARLIGTRMSGGRVELLLLRRLGDEPNNAVRWRALGRASKALRLESRLTFGELEAKVVARDDAELEVVLWSETDAPIDLVVERVGRMPLPPYIAKRRDGSESVDDAARYQTVFAKHAGAIAAPTAGLHLTEAMLERLRARGVEVAAVTLHVGLGTFQPVTTEDLDQHPMHSERFSLSSATVDAILAARARGAPVVAVGTTVVRALESAAASGTLAAGDGDTRLLIQPGYTFRVVDQLLTNFHLPKSTLLALVSAFAGHARTMEAYRVAVAERYRFFSYGDCMYLPRCVSASP